LAGGERLEAIVLAVGDVAEAVASEEADAGVIGIGGEVDLRCGCCAVAAAAEFEFGFRVRNGPSRADSSPAAEPAKNVRCSGQLPARELLAREFVAVDG
jgi:hypothetical protein